MNKKKKMGLYDYKSAIEAGVSPGPDNHWPSRVPSGPKEGLYLKLPGHPTMGMALEADKAMGYDTVLSKGRFWSYPKGDPRLKKLFKDYKPSK